MTKPFRIAQPGEFTFKRDGDGVETVETQGLIIGTTEPGVFGPALFLRPHATVIDVVEAERAVPMAQAAGFWRLGKPGRDQQGRAMPPVTVIVHVTADPA